MKPYSKAVIIGAIGGFAVSCVMFGSLFAPDPITLLDVANAGPLKILVDDKYPTNFWLGDIHCDRLNTISRGDGTAFLVEPGKSYHLLATPDRIQIGGKPLFVHDCRISALDAQPQPTVEIGPKTNSDMMVYPYDLPIIPHRNYP